MKIFRWFFSNAFLIILVVAVIYSYMYWGNLAGKDTPAGKAIAFLSNEFEAVDEFVTAVRDKNATDQDADQADTVQAEASQSEPTQSESTQGETSQPETVESVTQADMQTDMQAEAQVSTAQPTSEPEQAASQATSQVTSQSESASGSVVDSAADTATDSGSAPAPAPGSDMAASDIAVPATIQYSHNEKRIEQDSDGKFAEVAAPASTEITPAESAGEVQAAADSKPASPGPASPSPVSPGPASSNPATSNTAPVAAAAIAATASDSQPDQATTETSDDADRFVSEEIEQQLDNVDESGRVIDPSKTDEAVREEWINARESFYARDFDQSVQSYLNVIDQTSDNFDAYGELGNVYFSQGRHQDAAQAYFDAAEILIRRGQSMRARSLVGLLRRLDPAKAEELQNLLSAEG